MTARFVAVGEVMLDIGTEAVVEGGVVHAPIRVRVGGSPVTAALSAAAEGVESAVVGRVGADLAGRAVRDALIAAGVEPLLTEDPDLPTGTFFEAGSGESRAVVADRGANARLDAGAIEAEAALVSGYYLFRAAGNPLARIDAPWLAVDAGAANLVRLRPIARANALFLNEEEARALTGAEGEAALRALVPLFRLVCLKRGAEGAIAVLDGTVETRRPPEDVDGERAGAGDALAGALLASLLLGRKLGEALERGCAAGARTAAG